MKWFVFPLPLLAAIALNTPVRAADPQQLSVTGTGIVQAQPAIYYPDDQALEFEVTGVSVGASVQVFPGGGPYYYELPAPAPVYYYAPRAYYYNYPYYTYPYYGRTYSFNWYGGHGWPRWYGGHGWYGGRGWYGGHGWYGGRGWYRGGWGGHAWRGGSWGGWHGGYGRHR